MKGQHQAGFLLSAKNVLNDILIPRYYDPRITAALDSLKRDFHLASISELVAAGHIVHAHGDYVPKIFYGTGPFPYIRTSDLANWEIKASPKHGVPEAVYDEYAAGQGVVPQDILFVHEGTYLIGAVAMVTEYDGKLLYQHHIAKFSVKPTCPFNAFYLLAALESPLVHGQVRSKQFSADIIDSVVGRLEEVVVPYPKKTARLREIESAAEKAVTVRARLREEIAHAAEYLDSWLQGEGEGAWNSKPKSNRNTSFLGGRRGFSATTLEMRKILNDVLLPKYYDPSIASACRKYTKRCDLLTIGDLVERGFVSITTGDEIGRLNYGTGEIPFVRTSDFGSWELKREAKQGVSQEVCDLWSASQDVQAGDILVVRDGTYLVGTSVLVCQDDLPLLFCGGIYKLRSTDTKELRAGLLFALLNIPFVKRQIRNKQFTRDVIDTLGQRILEIVLPIPKEAAVRESIGTYFEGALAQRTRLRTELHALTEGLFVS